MSVGKKVLFSISNPPTKQFIWTRHNVGRLFVTQHLARKYPCQSQKRKNHQILHFSSLPNLIVCISQTYMNLSGEAVKSFFKSNRDLSTKGLLIVHDDLEHRFGNVRIKQGGSAQGHNGVSSIINSIGSNQFRRLQLGIDRPASRDPEDVANYVLANFTKSQKQGLLTMFAKAEQVLKAQCPK